MRAVVSHRHGRLAQVLELALIAESGIQISRQLDALRAKPRARMSPGTRRSMLNASIANLSLRNNSAIARQLSDAAPEAYWIVNGGFHETHLAYYDSGALMSPALIATRGFDGRVRGSSNEPVEKLITSGLRIGTVA